MDKETIIKLIPSTIAMIVTAIFGLVVGVLVEKFKKPLPDNYILIRTQKVTPALSENLMVVQAIPIATLPLTSELKLWKNGKDEMQNEIQIHRNNRQRKPTLLQQIQKRRT